MKSIRQFLVASRHHFLNYFFHEQWFLMIRLDSGPSTDWPRFRKLLAPDDRSWADPFPVYWNGKYYVFFEELIFRERKAHISVIVVDEHGNSEGPGIKVLEESHHLSYPFVLEWEGEHYMVPESAASKSIRLYKCVEFPFRWEFQKNLLQDTIASDTTLFRFQDHWWLFTNIGDEGKARNEKLFLFHSKDLHGGPWIPHPLNPVIFDPNRARGAGRIFESSGKIFRPSQNCSPGYGYGFHINEVTTLTETDYSERIVQSVEPIWDPKLKGTHSYNFAGNLTIIDGCRRLLRRNLV